MRRVIYAAIVIALMPVAAKDEKMQLRPGAKAMRNEIRRFIKTGTSIANADKIMTKNGFRCRKKIKEDFLATDGGSTDSKFIQQQDFLFCELTEPGYIAMAPSRRWRVALVDENGKVAKVLVSFETIEGERF